MAPDANVDVVRRFLRRLSDGDLEAVLEDLAEDAELDWSGSDAPDSGVYHGHAAWRAWLNGRREGLGELRFETSEVIDAPPDAVVTVARAVARGPASGVEVDALGAGVWTVREGSITGLTVYQTRDDALRAAGVQG
ncbi:MAG: SnoaL-like domain [Solirubrobacteraceae bacterium]|nr:SnoaL-like domain [Solirubrobacteraceae bacterium]